MSFHPYTKAPFGSRVLEGRGGEIFNLKCLVQLLEGEGREDEQILLHCQNYPYINLKSQYYLCNNFYSILLTIFSYNNFYCILLRIFPCNNFYYSL